MNALEAVIEIFSWIGFGAGVLLAVVAMIMFLADGTWTPVRAVVESTPTGRIVRWFDGNGDVNESALTDAQDREIGDRDMADIYCRTGWRNRMRLTPRSHAVRAVTLFAIGFLTLGVVALAVSLILLFAQG